MEPEAVTADRPCEGARWPVVGPQARRLVALPPCQLASTLAGRAAGDVPERVEPGPLDLVVRLRSVPESLSPSIALFLEKNPLPVPSQRVAGLAQAIFETWNHVKASTPVTFVVLSELAESASIVTVSLVVRSRITILIFWD